MFDFAWSEFALIGVVALVLIGPKDLPVAIKTVAQMVKKARRMAGEFQTHVDEMVREADLGDVRNQFNDLRRMDIKGKILSAVDGDGSIRRNFAEPMVTPVTTPFDINPAPPPIPVHDSPEAIAAEAATAVDVRPDHVIASPGAPAFVPPAPAGPPSFIPPQLAVFGRPQPPKPPPAFVPPAAVEAARARQAASPYA